MPSRSIITVRDHQLWEAFDEHPALPGAQSRRVSCKFCDKYKDLAVNVTRMRVHLHGCKRYLEDPRNAHHDIVQEKMRGLDPDSNPAPAPTLASPWVNQKWVKPAAYRQSQLSVDSLSTAETDLLDELASLAIYVGGRPLSFFAEPYLKALINRLNPAWQIPHRDRFSGALLDSAYSKMKELVNQVIKDEAVLNLVTDSSANINYDRLINISLHTSMGALYLESLEMEALRHGGQETADHLDTRIRAWFGDDLRRVNSIATDTENKMKTFMEALHQKPDWRHVFWAPCDSHGVQLLIQHIAGLPWFKKLFLQAQKIAVFFWKADKQLDALRRMQMRVYKRHFSLTLSILTRWGTQYRLIDSLLRSEEALHLWALDDETDRSTGRAVIQVI